MRHLPNLLTVIRFFLVPLFAVLFFSSSYLLAGGVFILAGVTDVIDGYLARKYQVVSTFGIIADPLADKAMQLTAVLCLYLRELLPLWALLILFGKELLMVAGGVLLYTRFQKTTVPAGWYGKAATCALYVTLLYIIFGPTLGIYMQTVTNVLMIATLFCMVFAFFMYGVGFAKRTRHPKTQ